MPGGAKHLLFLIDDKREPILRFAQDDILWLLSF